MRRIRSLIAGLPFESALLRSIDPERSRWDTTAELLACLVELTDAGNRLFLQANTKKGTRIPDPVHIPRPGERQAKKRPATPAEMKKFFGGNVAYVPAGGESNGT